MRIIYNSFFWKAFGVLRFLFVRLIYGRKLKASKLGLIGKRCGFHIFKNGRININGQAVFNDDVLIYTKGKLSLGHKFCINRNSRIVAHEEIEIGDNVILGQYVSILDHDHKYAKDPETSKLYLDGYITQKIKIGSNIWIGDKCTILKGVTIGDNVVVGANTLVHKDVPSDSIIGGVPFKILKKL